MAERLVENGVAVTSVLADRTVTSEATARKLELTEDDWVLLAELVQTLRPLQVATEVLCTESSPISSVRPIIHSLVNRHLKPDEHDDPAIIELKRTVSTECTARFTLRLAVRISSSAQEIAPFLDPRHKELQHEENVLDRTVIQTVVQQKSMDMAATSACTADQDGTNCSPAASAMDYLFGDVPHLKTRWHNLINTLVSHK